MLQTWPWLLLNSFVWANKILKLISSSSFGMRLPSSLILECTSPPLVLFSCKWENGNGHFVCNKTEWNFHWAFVIFCLSVCAVLDMKRRHNHNSEIKSRSLRRNYLICIYSPQNGWTQLISFIIPLTLEKKKKKLRNNSGRKHPESECSCFVGCVFYSFRIF